MSIQVVNAFLSSGPRASSRSGSERSPSSQEDVVQPDVNLHQDCHRSSRQRGRLRGPHSEKKHSSLLLSLHLMSSALTLKLEQSEQHVLFRFSFCIKNFFGVPAALTEIHVFTERNKTLTLVFLLLILNKGLSGF